MPTTSCAKEFRMRRTRCKDLATSAEMRPSRQHKLIFALNVESGESPSSNSSAPPEDGNKNRSSNCPKMESILAAPRITAARSDSPLNSFTNALYASPHGNIEGASLPFSGFGKSGASWAFGVSCAIQLVNATDRRFSFLRRAPKIPQPLNKNIQLGQLPSQRLLHG